MGLSADDFFDQPLIPPSDEGLGVNSVYGAQQAEKTSKKDYRAAYIYINVTSYSQRQTLHECARKYQIYKLPSMGGGVFTNLDFCFGHAVGAGIQSYLVTRNSRAALYACFLAWKADLDAEIPKKGKSQAFAHLAVQKFIYWWDAGFGKEWEIANFNGRPATELTFFLDCENGSYHAGHIDVILRHKKTGRYLILEIKTTAIRNVDEAQYGNSEQPLGYSLILDKIADDLNQTNSFEILYLVYSSTNRELVPIPFTKSRTERLEWLQDLLLDHTTVDTYRRIGFFPKRGDACWSFGGRCAHYGNCDLTTYKRTDTFKIFDRKTMPLPEQVDFEFTLSEITAAVMKDRVVKVSSEPTSSQS